MRVNYNKNISINYIIIRVVFTNIILLKINITEFANMTVLFLYKIPLLISLIPFIAIKTNPKWIDDKYNELNDDIIFIII